MDVKHYNIEGLMLLSPKVIGDSRGFFCERFRVDQFKEIGIHQNFIQDNYSRSDFGIFKLLSCGSIAATEQTCSCTGTSVNVAVDIHSRCHRFFRKAYHR